MKAIDTIPMGEEVTHVVFTPDGRRALATKSANNKIALLDVAGDKVTYSKHDLPVGIYPYNVVVADNGSIALTADNGNSGSSDGNVDTGERHRPDGEAAARHRSRRGAGQSEGLVMSPKGNIAATIVALGSNKNKKEFF